MTTTLLMYLCLAWDASGCSSQQVWVTGQWDGPEALGDCWDALLASRHELKTKSPDAQVRFECETQPVGE